MLTLFARMALLVILGGLMQASVSLAGPGDPLTDTQQQAQSEYRAKVAKLDEIERTLRQEYVGWGPQITDLMKFARSVVLKPELRKSPTILTWISEPGSGKSTLAKHFFELMDVFGDWSARVRTDPLDKGANSMTLEPFMDAALRPLQGGSSFRGAYVVDEFGRLKPYAVDGPSMGVARPDLSILFDYSGNGIIYPRRSTQIRDKVDVNTAMTQAEGLLGQIKSKQFEIKNLEETDASRLRDANGQLNNFVLEFQKKLFALAERQEMQGEWLNWPLDELKAKLLADPDDLMRSLRLLQGRLPTTPIIDARNTITIFMMNAPEEAVRKAEETFRKGGDHSPDRWRQIMEGEFTPDQAWQIARDRFGPEHSWESRLHREDWRLIPPWGNDDWKAEFKRQVEEQIRSMNGDLKSMGVTAPEVTVDPSVVQVLYDTVTNPLGGRRYANEQTSTFLSEFFLNLQNKIVSEEPGKRPQELIIRYDGAGSELVATSASAGFELRSKVSPPKPPSFDAVPINVFERRGKALHVAGYVAGGLELGLPDGISIDAQATDIAQNLLWRNPGKHFGYELAQIVTLLTGQISEDTAGRGHLSVASEEDVKHAEALMAKLTGSAEHRAALFGFLDAAKRETQAVLPGAEAARVEAFSHQPAIVAALKQDGDRRALARAYVMAEDIVAQRLPLIQAIAAWLETPDTNRIDADDLRSLVRAHPDGVRPDLLPLILSGTPGLPIDLCYLHTLEQFTKTRPRGTEAAAPAAQAVRPPGIGVGTPGPFGRAARNLLGNPEAPRDPPSPQGAP